MTEQSNNVLKSDNTLHRNTIMHFVYMLCHLYRAYGKHGGAPKQNRMAVTLFIIVLIHNGSVLVWSTSMEDIEEKIM